MIVWLLLKFFKNFCGEDEYQKSREIDKLPYINAKITIKNKIDNINDKIRATYEEYFSKKDEKAIKYETSVHISDSNEYLMKKSFEVYVNETNYLLYLDHRYFSGLFFMILGKNLFNIKPLNVMKEIYIPFVSEYYIIKFLIFMYWFSKNTGENLEMVNHKDDIRRETFNFNVITLNYDNKVKRKYRVLYHILSHIRSKLSLNRPLKILIPVAFEATEERYNNVGAIFCHFDGNLDNLINEIENNKYQAHVSNIIQRFSNSGKKARNLVDVVLSCGCFEGGSDIIEDNYVTYENIADYPVYCLAVTYDNEVKSTITWMNLH